MDAVSPEPLAKVATTVLSPLIGVKQRALRLAALLIAHVQGFDHQI
jgi:hypothetical protein